MADLFQSDVAPDFALHDDLSREVYCILGVPVDAIGMNAVLRRIGSASTAGTPFLISTPNPNSLVISQLDREFREALILSDLCTADGMPIIWIAWLIGIPIKKREIMMFIDEIESSAGGLKAADDDVRHHLRSDKIGHALLRSHAVKAVRDVLAENTKIDP